MTTEKPTHRDQGSISGIGEVRSEEKRELQSQDIFGGANSVTIVHAGATYILRITKQNKLILTK